MADRAPLGRVSWKERVLAGLAARIPGIGRLELRTKLLAGNWKMNGVGESLRELEELARLVSGSPCEVLICPPATLIWRMSQSASGTSVGIGGQNCHADVSGAFTGEVSAEMLADAGATHVILGHSERRQYYLESDADVRAKAEAAWRAGLVAIACVGETEAQRDSGETLEVVGNQFRDCIPDGASADRLVIAYEPVWAIGTGRTPTPQQIAEVHAHLRQLCVDRFGGAAGEEFRLLYGGSMNPRNAADILAITDVDGGLIGGASLKASDLGSIVAQAV